MVLAQSAKKGRLPTHERDALILRLRGSGVPILTIAEKAGCSEKTVRRTVDRRLQQLADRIGFESQMLRAQHLLELEQLRGRLAPLLTAATPSDRLGAIRTWLQLLERESRLLGLDQPMKVELAAQSHAAEALLQHLADHLPAETLDQVVDALRQQTSPSGLAGGGR